jgi:hypothetical protein
VCGIKAQANPTTNAIRWPPKALRTRAGGLCGIAKSTKFVLANAVATGHPHQRRKNKPMTMLVVATRVCRSTRRRASEYLRSRIVLSISITDCRFRIHCHTIPPSVYRISTELENVHLELDCFVIE